VRCGFQRGICATCGRVVQLRLLDNPVRGAVVCAALLLDAPAHRHVLRRITRQEEAAMRGDDDDDDDDDDDNDDNDDGADDNDDDTSDDDCSTDGEELDDDERRARAAALAGSRVQMQHMLSSYLSHQLR
jgi:hypothetical protein